MYAKQPVALLGPSAPGVETNLGGFEDDDEGEEDEVFAAFPVPRIAVSPVVRHAVQLGNEDSETQRGMSDLHCE